MTQRPEDIFQMQNCSSQLLSAIFAPLVSPISRIIGLLALCLICAQAATAQTGTWAWGINTYGALGGDLHPERDAPVRVLGSGGTGTLDGIISVSAGFFHSLGLKSDGTVWAWGRNNFGELGDNTTTDRWTPVQVLGPSGAGTLTGVIAISAKGYHSLALKSDGTVWAWGDNRFGQVGNNTTTQSNAPVQVVGPGGTGTLSGIVAIAAGDIHSLALKSDGTLWAWGVNQWGELGDNTTTNRSAPVQVLDSGGTGALSNVVAISANAAHSLALKSDGTVWSWGYNFYGQLGNNTTTNSSIPLQVLGPGGAGTLSGIVSIAALEGSSIALKSDGTVWAWGDNGSGQLGDNTKTQRNAPVQVLGPGGSGFLTGVIAISGHAADSRALKSDGTVWGWGNNHNGQLGDNTTGNDRLTPVQVRGPGGSGFLTGMTEIGSGSEHGLATKPQLSVSTSPSSAMLQLGVASVTFSSVTSAGTLDIARIDSTTQGSFSGYSFNSIYPAFDISTTATPGAGPISVCLNVPDVIDQTAFSHLRLLHQEAGVLVDRTVAADYATHLVCGTVTSLSPFVVASNLSTPTAAAANISGQITDADNIPLSGAVLTLSGANNLKAITDSNGNYRFSDLEAGSFYTLTPSRANYSFRPASRSFSLLADKTDAMFIATADSVEMKNPLDTSEYFVRQQYLDFLGREPDAGGFNYWSAQFDACRDDAACLNQKRINISAAFFIEQEFQQTGSFVYRLYKASFGTRPSYAPFSKDRSRVIGSESLETSKASLSDEFVSRTEFKAVYPDSLSSADFVNKLFDTAGLEGDSAERQTYINMLNSGGTRSQVLLGVVENDAFKTKEYNPSFVLMQYFGYLRRDADEGGYQFWLNVLNTREPNNYRGMVCSFITSAEYQKRFAAAVIHSNSECAQ